MKVKFIDGVPTVIDSNGVAVQGAIVHKIDFDNAKMDTPQGTIHYITGPGTADISLTTSNGRQMYFGVSLS